MEHESWRDLSWSFRSLERWNSGSCGSSGWSFFVAGKIGWIDPFEPTRHTVTLGGAISSSAQQKIPGWDEKTPYRTYLTTTVSTPLHKEARPLMQAL